MGKVPIITKKQKLILEGISKSEYLRKNFYFTGGTALSEYYLQHRYSDDLDFFSEDKFENQVILGIVDEWSKQFNFSYTSRFVEVVYRFELHFEDNYKFLLDFGHYPYKRIEKGLTVGNIQLDSLRDIATNKLFTVNQRTDVKDFVDLYFIIKKKFTIWDLIYSAEVKFRKMNTDIELIAMDLMKVDDFTALPRMIKPLTLEELKNFYNKLAVKLGRRVVR